MQTGSQRAEYSGLNATAQWVDIYTVDVTTLRNLCYQESLHKIFRTVHTGWMRISRTAMLP